MAATPSSGPAGSPAPRGAPNRSRWWLAVPTLGGTCLVLIAISLAVFLLVQGTLKPQEDPNEGMEVQVTKLISTVVEPGPTGVSPAVSCETVISSDEAETIASPPITLTVGAVSFPVAPVVPVDGQWAFPDGASVAAWVCGTVVNYVLELEPTEDNDALLVGLKQGDEIGLSLSNGTGLQFRVDVPRSVSPDLGDLLAQTRPRLTLLSRQRDSGWQAAIANYVSESEASRPPVTALAKIGEPVRVEDVLLTVTSAGVVRGGIELEPETMVYLVEFTIENVGDEPWRTDWVVAQLQDGAGNRYLMSPAASAVGEHGPLLGGEIQPGAMEQASVGYIVPEALPGPALIWTFVPRSDAPSKAYVVISYEADTGSDSPDIFTVSVTDVFLNMRGDVLHVEGEIRNAGEGPLTLGLSDIIMTSSAGMADLHLAAPPLPWTIEPGQMQVIELQFARPNASAALLTILGYSFEIQGLG